VYYFQTVKWVKFADSPAIPDPNMKMLLKVLGAIVVCLVVALLVLRVTGLPPHDRMPGLWLKGNLVTTPVTDWSFTDNFETVQVQTNTSYLIPHSVTTYCVAYNVSPWPKLEYERGP
jgi:hypothetical protein